MNPTYANASSQCAIEQANGKVTQSRKPKQLHYIACLYPHAISVHTTHLSAASDASQNTQTVATRLVRFSWQLVFFLGPFARFSLFFKVIKDFVEDRLNYTINTSTPLKRLSPSRTTTARLIPGFRRRNCAVFSTFSVVLSLL